MKIANLVIIQPELEIGGLSGIIMENENDKIVNSIIRDADIPFEVWYFGCIVENCQIKNKKLCKPPYPVPMIRDSILKNCKIEGFFSFTVFKK